MDERQFHKALLGQQRRFDDQLVNFRQFYESADIEDRPKIRDLLEHIISLNETCDEFGMGLSVSAENNKYDDDGNVISWSGCQFSPTTMLLAIKAWDAGDHFAPKGARP